MIAAVAAIAIGATTAFFSDTETSTGNTFTAGAIDLKIDNTSYVTNNAGVLVQSISTSWTLADLTDQLFFNFTDLKPGDIGEDTISLHVNNNDAWACMSASITGTPENNQTEPEVADDSSSGSNEGELQNALDFAFWADDGDNVLENNELLGPANQGIFTGTIQQFVDSSPRIIADPTFNIFTGTPGTPLAGGSDHYIGKAWCFGTLTPTPLTQDNLTTDGPIAPNRVGTGFTCNGSALGNETQTDGVIGNISFYVEQSRNNPNFSCANVDLDTSALGPDSVSLGSANGFVIVAKTAITDAGAPLSAITGNIAIDPTAGSSITGVSCTNVLGGGKIYSSGGYTGGYNTNTTCALTNPVTALAVRSAMETAYTDAAGRAPGVGATNLNVGGGTLNGQNFVPGTYTWNTPGNVTITGDITLTGDANDIWIFQITGTLDIASGGSPSGGADVVLAGGALAKNVFWQVAGATTLGTYSTFNGTILAKTNIAIQTGATLNGRALAQTAVTLDANTVTLP